MSREPRAFWGQYHAHEQCLSRDSVNPVTGLQPRGSAHIHIWQNLNADAMLVDLHSQCV